MNEKVEGKNDSTYNLKARTTLFALTIVRLVGSLPKCIESIVLGKQLLRSGTSVGAQYREASRAKTDPDFISKIEGCLQELEESRYWLELLSASKLISQEQFGSIDDEVNQLIAIFVTIVKKVKAKSKP